MKPEIAFLLLCLILVSCLHIISVLKKKIGQPKGKDAIPKRIWTYWQGDVPKSIQKNIDTWKRLNPTWTIHLLNNNNLQTYLHPNDLPSTFYNDIETPQYSSDIVRVIMLYTYGGVWLDASIVLLKPLDWVLHEYTTKDIDYLGYYMPNFTTNTNFKIIESWFISSKPNTMFLKLVYGQMVVAFGNRKAYLNNLSKSIDLQNIPKTLRTYLCIHVCMQVVLQTRKIDMRRFVLIDANRDAFALHSKFGWDSKKVVAHMKTKEFTMNNVNYNLIKLRGDERKALLERR